MARVVLHSPRFSRPVVWAALCLAATAITVQITRTGIDILALMSAGFVLLLVERTLGDWIADNLGPAATAFVFACVAAIGVSYSMTGGGRAKAQRVFAAAEARGYHTLYFTLDDSKGSGSESDEADGLPNVVGGAGDKIAPAADSRARVTPGRVGPAPGPRLPQPALAGGSGASTPSRSPGSSAAGGSTGTLRLPSLGSAGDEQADGGPLTIFRLILNPEVVMTGDRVTLRALVHGQSDAPALVEFSIDGHTVSTAPIGRDGIAKATFSTRAPGQYTVRARIVGGPLRIMEVSALLSVLPGRR